MMRLMHQRFCPHSTPVNTGVGGQRRIGCPAGGRMPTRDEEAAQHNDRRGQRHPERQHIEHWKGHIAGADHQGDQEIAEGANQNRHDHKEHHDRGMHGEQHVVGIGCDDTLGFRK